jgi:hypothetical protein
MDKKIIQKAGKYYTETERHQIIQELISTGCTKEEIWEKYTGEQVEHGRLLLWMRALGYDLGIKRRSPNIVSTFISMPKNKQNKNIEDFENLQLKKRVAELEKQLKDAEMKAIAFSTMVDIAEDEFKIPIRKKFNTKP